MESKFYTVKELAAVFRVNARTIYNLAAAGDLPHTRVGRTYRFDKARIEEWIKDNTFGG
jgi:excisionase family DNA binding protein